MKNIWFVILALSLLLTSCSRRTIPASSSMPSTTDAPCNAHKTDSVTSGTVTYADNSKRLTANIQLFLDKEHNCYFQASVLFIEACRGLMTADSLFLLNRLDRTCLQASVTDIEKAFGVTVTPASLFTLLTGSYCVNELASSCHLTPKIQSNDHAQFTSERNYTLQVNRLGNTSNISDLTIADKKGQTVATVSYDGLRNISGTTVPDQIVCTQTKPQRSVTVQFKQMAFDVQKSVSFVVPSSYKRKNLKF